jgi:O-antigen ligase
MSARRRRERPRSAPETVQASSSGGLAPNTPLILVSFATALVSVWGGMIYDRVTPREFSGLRFYAVPLTLCLAAVAFLLACWRPPAESRAGNRSMRSAGTAFCLFAVWCAVSCLRSTDLHTSLKMLPIVVAAIMTGAVIAGCRTRSEQLAAAVVVAATATVVSVIGLNEYVERWHAGNALWRVFAGFVNPDFLAGYLLMTVPLTAGLLIVAKTPAMKLLAVTGFILQAACLIVTFSRLGFAALTFSLILFGLLLLRSGAAGRSNRKAILLVFVLLAGVVVVAGGPLLRRLLASGGESYSAQFRLYTWRGTARMVAANPVLGTGVGSFETAYQPYAVVSYTQHAHNGFLQLAAETGLLGLLLFIAGIAMTIWSALRVLFRKVEPPIEESVAPAAMSHPFESRALLAALVAGFAAAVLHNLFDSDFYTPANAFMFAAVCGLILSLSRSELEGALEGADIGQPVTGKPAAKWRPAMAAVLSLMVIGMSAMIAGGRVYAAQADEALQAGNGRIALDRYRDARGVDPLNTEHVINAARLLALSGQHQEAKRLYEEALRSAPVSRHYRLYGRLLTAMQLTGEAVKAHERARNLAPTDLQNLLALGEAYRIAGRTADAEATYGRMVEMSRGPVGRVRAVPELVAWEYGMAYSYLGEMQFLDGRYGAAAENLKQAAGLLGEYWRQRGLEMAIIIHSRSPEILELVAKRYDEVLVLWANALQALGRSQEAKEVQARRETFLTERRAEEEKAKAESGSL